MRLIEDRLNSGEVDYKDVVTIFLAMQKQNFVLANSLLNLVKKMADGPTYYKRGSTDVWDFIREQGLNFHLGKCYQIYLQGRL